MSDHSVLCQMSESFLQKDRMVTHIHFSLVANFGYQSLYPRPSAYLPMYIVLNMFFLHFYVSNITLFHFLQIRITFLASKANSGSLLNPWSKKSDI